MAKTVKRIWPFMWADYKSAEKYLEKMAAKGLMLKAIDDFLFAGFGFIATYEVTKPQKRKFCIDGFKGNTEDVERYMVMAEDAGWYVVAADYGILIFASKENENPTPLQTDWKNEYRLIRKSFWKIDIPLGIGALLIIYMFYKLESLEDVNMFEPINLTLIYILLFFIFSLAGLFRAVTFYIRSELAIRRDVPLKQISDAGAKLWGMLHSVIGLLIALIMFGRLAAYLYNGVFSGETYKMVYSSIIAISLAGIMILSHLEITSKNKYVKMLFIGLLLIGITVSFVYCGTGCEVVVEA